MKALAAILLALLLYGCTVKRNPMQGAPRVERHHKGKVYKER